MATIDDLFSAFVPGYLNRNITFTLFFIVVIAARLLLVRCPRKYSYMLWSLLGIKAVFDFGLLTVSDIVGRLFEKHDEAIAVSGESTGFVGKAVTVIGTVPLTETANEIETVAKQSFDKWYLVIAAVWALGVLLLIATGIMSYAELNRKVKLSFEDKDVRVCDYIDSPMVFGILKPAIYVPSGVEVESLTYVIKHERVHLRRHDTFFKLLAFAILSFYWMNPLAWVAFKLFNLDMELSCDEAVLQKETVSVKEAYGKWLVFFASKGSVFGPAPTSFGETDVEKRVKNMKNIKAVKGGVIVLAVLIVAGAAVLFLVKAPKLFKTPEKIAEETGDEPVLTVEVNDPESDRVSVTSDSPLTLEAVGEKHDIPVDELMSLNFSLDYPEGESSIVYSLSDPDQREITIDGKTYTIYMDTAWVWPLEEGKGYITATYGQRTPFTDEDGNESAESHLEVDIAAEEGTPVMAAKSGEITFAGWEEETGCGNVVIIKVNDYIQIKYSHLKSVSVKVGDTVNAGDVVGELGNTGYSTGPHLGFQIQNEDGYVDPMEFYERN